MKIQSRTVEVEVDIDISSTNIEINVDVDIEAEHAKKIQKAVRKVAEAFRLE